MCVCANLSFLSPLFFYKLPFILQLSTARFENKLSSLKKRKKEEEKEAKKYNNRHELKFFLPKFHPSLFSLTCNWSQSRWSKSRSRSAFPFFLPSFISSPRCSARESNEFKPSIIRDVGRARGNPLPGLGTQKAGTGVVSSCRFPRYGFHLHAYTRACGKGLCRTGEGTRNNWS